MQIHLAKRYHPLQEIQKNTMKEMKSKPQESPVLRFAAYDRLPAFVELCTAYV